MPKLTKAAILSISLLTVMSGAAVAPALGEIYQAFPEAGVEGIRMVLTLPCLLIILGSLISGRLVAFMDKRRILISGLFFYLLGGLGAGLVASFVQLLIMRAIMGIGVGLIMPLSISLIADYFTGNEQVQTMGLSTAISSLGGIIGNVLAGILAVISWRWSFSVYALGFPALFLVLFYLPKPKAALHSSGDSIAHAMPKSVYYIGLLTFGLLIVFFSVPTSLAMYIQNQQLGSANTAGLGLGLANLFVFLAGTKFQSIYSRLKTYIVPCGLLLLGAGFALLSSSSSLLILFTGLVCFGLGFGILIPLVFLQTTRITSEVIRPRATALVGAFFYLGQFASPLFLSLVGKITGDYSIRLTFIVLACSLLLALLVSILITRKQPSSKSSDLINEENCQ